ncbi:hypothetical protein B296_00015515 [Ensete ventricosum]|uniref:Uncharacterized protein n=1 Tax=Ensete ventricosum TaxID=4639 RepID=A0A426YYI6_ENSVE|nr:hypothetical protein B296_00015515 [Ensete ventricosum]
MRLHYIPGACLAGLLGVMADVPMITLIAICKSPYMLFKGWRRLFHDLIGREGPFLETACVPFAGLAIILWPLAVAGAVMASIISSVFLGAYAAVIAYQLLDHLFSECKRHGEVLVSEGVITQEDILESRLQGITKSISRYPTARRRFDDLVKSLSEDLEKKFGSNRSANGSQGSQRSVVCTARYRTVYVPVNHRTDTYRPYRAVRKTLVASMACISVHSQSIVELLLEHKSPVMGLRRMIS